MSCKYRVKLSDEAVTNLANATGISLTDARNRVQAQLDVTRQTGKIEVAVAVLHDTNHQQLGYENLKASKEYLVSFPGQAQALTVIGEQTEQVPPRTGFYLDGNSHQGCLAKENGEVISFEVDARGIIQNAQLLGERQATSLPQVGQSITTIARAVKKNGLHTLPARPVGSEDLEILVQAQLSLNQVFSKNHGSIISQGRRRASQALKNEFGTLASVHLNHHLSITVAEVMNVRQDEVLRKKRVQAASNLLLGQPMIDSLGAGHSPWPAATEMPPQVVEKYQKFVQKEQQKES